MKVIVIHQYGAPRHFESLTLYCQENNIELEMYEFDIIRNFLRNVKNKRYSDNKKVLRNVFYFIGLLVKRVFGKSEKNNNVYIIGAAPLDKKFPILSKLLNEKKIVYYSSWPYWKGEKWVFNNPEIYPKWVKALNKMVTVGVSEKASEELAEISIKNFNIPHSVNQEIFTKINVLKKEKNILFVGRLEPEKGILDLIETIKMKEFKEYSWTFIGYGSLMRTLKKLELDYKVKVIPFEKDPIKLREIYHNASVLVLPSKKTKNWEELFGIVLIEAMACGLPLIANDNIGPREIIKHGVNGYLVENGDITLFRKYLKNLLLDDYKIKELGENGHRLFKSKYDINVLKKQWGNVINFSQEND